MAITAREAGRAILTVGECFTVSQYQPLEVELGVGVQTHFGHHYRTQIFISLFPCRGVKALYGKLDSEYPAKESTCQAAWLTVQRVPRL